MDFSGILKHLGIIKDQLLIFSVLGQAMTHGCGLYLDKQVDHFQKLGGMGLHGFGIAALFVFGGFYVYALKNLPPTVQARKFEESLTEQLKHDATVLPRRVRKTKTRP